MIAGTLELQMLANLVRLSEDMGKAKNMVAEGVTQINKILSTVGAGLSFAAIAHLAEQTNAATASFTRLGEVAGSTAEQMSKFEVVSKLAGTSIDTIAGSIAKLSRSIGEAQLGDPGKRDLFAALGIDPDKAKDPVEAFISLARVVGEMTDQNVAAKVSAELLGKSFAEMRPVFKEIIEQGTLYASVTNKQSAEAKELEDNLIKVKQLWIDSARALVSDLTPGLTKATEAMLKYNKELGYLKGLQAGMHSLITGLFGGVDLNEQDEKIKKMLAGSGTPVTVVSEAQKAAIEAKRQATEEAEARVRDLMKFLKEYDSLLTEAKASANLFADLMKTENAVLKELAAQGVIDQAELIRRTAENEGARLQVLRNSLDVQMDLAERKGDLNKQQQIQEQIDMTKQQQGSLPRVTQAQLDTLDIKSVQEYNAALARQVENVIVANQTELQVVQEKFRKRQEILDEASQRELITQEFWEGQTVLLAAEKQKELTRIEDEETKRRYGISQVYHEMNLESASSFLGTLGGMMQSHSRAAFNIGKVAAIAQTTIDTYRAAQGAYAALAGIPIVGPILGAAAAAAAIVVGIARVQQIKSTQFGGGGPSGGGATGTFPANPVTGVPTAPISPTQQTGQSQVVINVTITNSGVLGDDGIRRLIDEEVIPNITDAINNRDVVIIGANSRQAAELT